jgi:phosphoribosyl 1,2-cyclic phosphodiesterase
MAATNGNGKGGFSVRFWGVRGSVATSGSAFLGTGGNTTCIEVRAGAELIIFDAGTGLVPLGQTLGSPLRATFLLTHFHWDHIQGFPFFGPAYQRGNHLTLFGPGARDKEVKAAFEHQMQPPHFPVTLDALQARIDFRGLRPGDELRIGPASVRTGVLNHPQSCLGYRISMDGASVVLATDTEPMEGAEVDPGVLDLARGADLLIHDAQYTEEQYHLCGRRGWGHSTYSTACQVAAEAGVKQLVLFHHDPSHDDRAVGEIEQAARSLFPNTLLAREGMTLKVKAPGSRAEAVATPPVSTRAQHAA